MNQLNQESGIKKLQYVSLVLLLLIAGVGFIDSDQTRYAWTVFLSVLLVSVAIVMSSYYQKLRREFHRFAIGVKEGLEVVGTDEFDHLNHKPVVERSLEAFQSMVEVHRRLESLLESQNADDVRTFEELNKLKELITKRADYISTMSHELRTPLNSIIGFAELILFDISREKYDRVGVDTEKIRKAGSHLLALVNSILDLARLDSNRTELHLEKIDISYLVSFLEELLLPQFKSKSLSYEFKCADNIPVMMIDGGRVRQVLLNILGNAIKFTERGKVTLDVKKVFWNERDFVCFSVTDDGPGISKDDIEVMFERFVQVHDQSKVDVVGSGLGLSLAQAMVAHMSGHIKVESELGKGSTFRVFLPIDKDKGEKVTDEATKVLLVEDDCDARETWREWLASEGYDVLAAENGKIAFEVFKNESPQVVITDVIMPGGGGRELITNLQNTNPSVPIIIVTGENLTNEIEAGELRNISKVFLKPFDPIKLSEEVAKLTKFS